MYVAAEGDLSFGDIFSAAWFFDAYLRRDAVPLVEFQTGGGARAWRRADSAPDRDIVFAHGQQRSAILLGDDCEIATIVRRRGRNRLVFAAIDQLPTATEERERALETRAFRRFPLVAVEGFPGGIVELDKLFAMSVDGVLEADGVDPRIARLNEESRLALEIRWNAYAVRRGPLTHLDHAEKLARLLTAAGDEAHLLRLHDREEDPSESHVSASRHLIAALNAGWELEGAVMNRVAESYERREGADTVLEDVITALKRAAGAAQRAAAGLEALHSSDDGAG